MNIINVHKTGWDFGSKQNKGSEVAEIVSVCPRNRIGFTVRLISHQCGRYVLQWSGKVTLLNLHFVHKSHVIYRNVNLQKFIFKITTSVIYTSDFRNNFDVYVPRVTYTRFV
jgi:hypothetical protein